MIPEAMEMVEIYKDLLLAILIVTVAFIVLMIIFQKIRWWLVLCYIQAIVAITVFWHSGFRAAEKYYERQNIKNNTETVETMEESEI